MGNRFDDRERSSWRNQGDDRSRGQFGNDRGTGSFYDDDRARSGGNRSDRGRSEWRGSEGSYGRSGDNREEWGGRRGEEGSRENSRTGLRGAEYRNDSGYTTSDRQHSGSSEYGRGYNSEWPRHEGGYGQAGMFGAGSQSQGSRGGYGQRDDDRYSQRSLNYGGSDRESLGGRYEESGYESLSGRGHYDARESGINYGGDRSSGRGGDWQRGGEGRGEMGRGGDRSGDRSRGGWQGGYEREESEGSFGDRGRGGSGWSSERGSNLSSRDYERGQGAGRGWGQTDAGERANRENDYGRTNYMGHGDNYRRGDGRSEFGRRDLEDERRGEWGRERR